jgi:hypothetical protein
VAQVVEHLPNKLESLIQYPIPPKKRHQEKNSKYPYINVFCPLPSRKYKVILDQYIPHSYKNL